MHENKNPNRPLIIYYIIALVVVMLLNALLFPQIERYSVQKVQYSENTTSVLATIGVNNTRKSFNAFKSEKTD